MRFWAPLLLLCSLVSAQEFNTEYQTALDSLNALHNAAEDKVAGLQTDLANANAQIVTLQQQVGSSDVKVFDRLEYGPWNVNSNGSQVGGSGLGTAAWAPPNVSSAFLGITPTGQYFDTYYSRHFTGDVTRVRFVYNLSFLFPANADSLGTQALEFEIHQAQSGFTYDYAVQFDFADAVVRTYDYGAKAWIATSIPLPRWPSGTWERVSLESHRDAGNYFLDALTVNGARTVLNISRVAPVTNWSDQITPAIQLDGNKAGSAYRVYLDDVAVRAYAQ